MLPLRDENPRRTLPFVTVLIILANIAVFLYELSLGPRGGQELVAAYGMIPARFDLLLTSHDVTLGQAFTPLLTSLFLHGGLLHLAGNMWFLWVFGDNIEDHLGHLKYLLFYLVCGVGAGVVHTVANLASRVPAVGASGAISGVMGAYLVLFPGARIYTWIPPIFILPLPSVVVLLLWFALQFLSGVGSLGVPSAGGVAWWAHIGGFILGALLVLGSRRR
jgi:membrane associated rhomboid family serine protease